MKNIISIILLLSSLYIFPQQQINWQNYADMKSVKDIIATNDGIWAATKGGAFFFSLTDSTYTTFSKVEGLNGIDLTAVAIDNDDKIWFGSASGIIDVYNPQSGKFYSILDIFNFSQSAKQINDIKVSGDTIIVASDFGVSLINSKTYFFYDTFFKFGTFTSYIKVNEIIKSDLIYVATNSGIAIQKPGASNLSAPESWNVYNNAQGLPNDTISSITFYEGTLIAGTDNGLYSFNGTDWQTYLSLTNTKILNIKTVEDSLFILSKSKLFKYDGSTLSELITFSETPTKLAYTNSSELLVGTNKGLLNSSGLLYPNGPSANQFPYMTFDMDGNFWSSSGKDVTGVGLYKYNGTNWETYNVSKYPEMYTNSYYSVFGASDNSVYGGNWGQGFIKIKNGVIQRFHAGNSPMVGVPGSSSFVVISSFAEDLNNNIWALNLRPGDKKSLYLLTQDNTWYSFGNPLEQHGDFGETRNLVIDRNGTKWYALNGGNTLGLFYYNEKKLSDLTDDVYGYVSTQKLSTNDVMSLAVDLRGDLWIGGSPGINIISNVDAVISSSNPIFKFTNSFSVRQQTINAIAVDPLNQKWLGTNQGLFLVSSDGTQLLASLDTKNSPLLSNIIESLAFDKSSGKLYVGTASGLTSFETPSINPVESFAGLNIYPNPLKISDGSKLVTIDGLIRDTDIKIFSVSGKLVREFSSPGGRVAFWDGRDDYGKFVNSGVYIVVAYDKEGNNVETGKIAVIKE
jgi:ligand-binding sensor domain-containing protein